MVPYNHCLQCIILVKHGMFSPSSSRNAPKADPCVADIEPQDLLATARQLLESLHASGDARAADALAALARPLHAKTRPMERILSRLHSSRGEPASATEWSEAFDEAKSCNAEAWEADCVRAILSLPEGWEGLDFLRFLDDDDELGFSLVKLESLFSFVDRASTIGQGLGHPAHELIHRLLAGSDFGPACGISLDAEHEKRLIELIFRAPRCVTIFQAQSALSLMWDSLWAVTENGTLSGLAGAKATSSLFAAHTQLAQPLSGFLAPGFGHPAAALFTQGSEPEPDDFPACWALLRAEGWSMSVDEFTKHALSLVSLGSLDAERRACNLAEVARSDLALVHAETRGLPLAYHLNTLRTSIVSQPVARGEVALDRLFCKLCALGMNPLDIWPERSAVLVSGSASIRSEVERALFIKSLEQGTKFGPMLPNGSRRAL